MNSIVNSSSQNILFVTGTDTGVGKTLVCALLAAALSKRKITLSVFKPVETGCEPDAQGELIAKDAQLLRSVSGKTQSMDQLVPYRFRAPVAPSVAAESEGVIIDHAVLLKKIEEAQDSAKLLIIEGAGGLLVPLHQVYTYADLISACGAAVLVVVGSRLGAINHSLLTFEVLARRQIPVVGYVYNDLFNREAESLSRVDALNTNRELLKEQAAAYKLKEICALPYLSTVVQEETIASCADAPAVAQLSDAVVDYFGINQG